MEELKNKPIEIDSNIINNLIQNIIDKTFKSGAKTVITNYNDRYNFACPYCGDSHSNPNKKRGNLYKSKLNYVCFNCGIKKYFNNMIKEFELNLSLENRISINKHIQLSIDNNLNIKTDIHDANFDNLLDFDDVKKLFSDGHPILDIYDFKPIQKNSLANKYLEERHITLDMCKDIFEAKHYFNPKQYETIILYLNRRGNKVLGVQTRNLKNDKYRSFVIYNYSSLYKLINNIEGDDINNELDIYETTLYDKLSYFFNILNINTSKTITVFEGYLDSLFFNNSIGVIGVNTDTSMLDNTNLDIRYFYDNDDTGNYLTEIKLNSGKNVFLWQKFINNVLKNKKNDNSLYTTYTRIQTVKDLNKLVQILGRENVDKFNLSQYFTSNIYDKYYIPKSKLFDKKLKSYSNFYNNKYKYKSNKISNY